MFFVTFVLFAQFVLVNIVIAVLMKHLRVPEGKGKENEEKEKTNTRQPSMRSVSGKTTPVTGKPDESVERVAFSKWHAKVRTPLFIVW